MAATSTTMPVQDTSIMPGKHSAVWLFLIAAAAPLEAQQVPRGTAPATADQPLTRADFIQQMDAEFRRFDGDANGMVRAEEIAAAQRKSAQADALRQNQAIFASLDKNRNGALDAGEFAALVNPAAIAVDPSPLMGQLDNDRDGVVTLVEYRIVTQANFDRIDSDRDGVVTATEMRAGKIIR